VSRDDPQWFVGERARALATVYLTRRDDLVVTKAGPGTGLDLLIFITKKEREPSVRQFGVFLRGAKGPVTEARADRILRPTMQSFLRVGPFPYPVSLFYFTMEDDQGYYTWVAEPAVEAGQPQLRMHEAAHCPKLDAGALGEIVEKVDRWYDAFFSRIAVQAS
jgi:hypothetical protein